MKSKFKVERIQQNSLSVLNDKGELVTAPVPLVKLVPVDLPCGDVVLPVVGGTIEFAPGVQRIDPKTGLGVCWDIAPNSLISRVTGTVGGGAVEFEAGAVYEVSLARVDG